MEVERLVVRLVGDGSSYQSMIEGAVKNTEQVGGRVQGAASRIEGITNNLEGFARGAEGLLLRLGLAIGAWKAFETFDRGEKTMIRLEAAIKANGGAVASTVSGYESFAAQMMNTYALSKDSTRQLLKQAETFELTGNTAMVAAKQALALGASNDLNASSMMRMTAAMAKGDLHTAMMFARMIPQLRGVRDEAQFLDKYNKLVAGGMEVLSRDAETVGGKFQKMRLSLGQLTKQIGGFISEAIAPVVGWLTKAVDWFNQLDPVIRKVVVGVLAVTGAFLLIGPAVAVLTPVFAPILAGIGAMVGLLSGPVLIGIGLVVAAVLVVVDMMGGWAEAWQTVSDAAVAAWDWIKAKVLAFYDWVKPIAQAYFSFLKMEWDFVKDVVKAAVDFIVLIVGGLYDAITTTWTAIFGETTINWTQIRDFIRDSILMAQFVIRNFGAFMSLLWTKAKLDFVVFSNEVEYFFVQVIPTTMTWFGDNWRDIFTDVWNWTTTVFKNLGENIVSVFEHLPELIAGTTDWGDVWKPLQQGFVRVSKELVLPDRVMGDIEKQLRKQFDEQAAALGQSWEQFHAEKLKEFGLDPTAVKNAVKQAGDVGNEMGEMMGKGVKDQMKKLDATLALSAKGVASLREYADILMFGVQKGKSSSSPAVSSASAAGYAEQQKSNNILMDIRDILKEQTKVPKVEIDDADFGGGGGAF